MRCVIAGATGLLGSALCKELRTRGDEVVVLSRDASRVTVPHTAAFSWDPVQGPPPPNALEGAQVVVNLAGESVAGGRWTDARKKRIRDSRVLGAEQLMAALRAMEARPAAYVSASAVGIYGDRGSELLTENSLPGGDFLAHVCVEWERAAQVAESLGMRRVSVRFGVVLDPHGGALEKLLPLFATGLGGKLGDGKQFFPWIHLDDAVGLLLRAMDDATVHGPLNAVAPGVVDNATFTQVMGKVLHRPTVFTVPSLAMKAALGEMSSALLGSQRVVPEKAQKMGFAFAFPELEPALREIAARR